MIRFMNPDVSKGHIGLSYGLVREVILGHPQFKQITVMGSVVNNASMLCECATRSRSIILTDKQSCEIAEGGVETTSYTESDIKRLAGVCEVVAPARIV